MLASDLERRSRVGPKDDCKRLGQLSAVEKHGCHIAGNLFEQPLLGIGGDFHDIKAGCRVGLGIGRAIELDFEQPVGQLPRLDHFGLGRAPRPDALHAAKLQKRSTVVLEQPRATAVVRLVRHSCLRAASREGLVLGMHGWPQLCVLTPVNGAGWDAVHA